jgi:general stress protein 26
MSDQKNLGGMEAIEKMRKIILDEDICLFATRLNQVPLDTRPMSTSGVDEEGNIWFMSRENSSKNTDIQQDKRVQLFYSHKSNSEYLSIYGEAVITKDRNRIEELWSPIDKAWFEKGKDDPEITLIKVRPLDVKYWDTKSNRVVSLIKILGAALTGKTADDGVEGKLAVNLQK